jgi:hypothetical protein
MRNLKMFALVFMGLITLTLVSSCNKDDRNESINEENYISQFFLSKSFIETDFEKELNERSLTFSNTFIKYTTNEKNISVPVVYSFIYSGKKLVGAIEGVRFNKSLNSSNFNILLRDFSKYNAKEASGSIILRDLTEAIDFFSMEINNGEVVKVNSFIDSNNNSESLETRNHPMDTNKDGNVTFSECYKYANNACSNDPDCFTLCYGVGDAAGWVLGGFPQCQAAMGAACVYTAAVN